MADQYLGEIRAFGFGLVPKGWLPCNGQILQISQNQALFALLGTQYGGDGKTTFQLPDLRGRLATSQGPANPTVGQTFGEETHTLTTAEMPSHAHSIGAQTNGTAGATNVPGTSVMLGTATTSQPGNPQVLAYGSSPPNAQMLPINAFGGSQPHENRMPFLAMNYCIALTGIFPSRS